MKSVHVTITVEVSDKQYFSSKAGKAEIHMELPIILLGDIATSELVTTLLEAALEDHRDALVASTLKKDEELKDDLPQK